MKMSSSCQVEMSGLVRPVGQQRRDGTGHIERSRAGPGGSDPSGDSAGAAARQGGEDVGADSAADTAPLRRVSEANDPRGWHRSSGGALATAVWRSRSKNRRSRWCESVTRTLGRRLPTRSSSNFTTFASAARRCASGCSRRACGFRGPCAKPHRTSPAAAANASASWSRTTAANTVGSRSAARSARSMTLPAT